MVQAASYRFEGGKENERSKVRHRNGKQKKRQRILFCTKVFGQQPRGNQSVLYLVSGEVPPLAKPLTQEVAPTTPNHDESGQHTRPSTTRLAGQQPVDCVAHCEPQLLRQFCDGMDHASVPVFQARLPLAKQ